MSFKASHWAVHEVQNLKPQERLLLLILAEHTDDRDCVWPSQDRLADKMEMSLPTLRRCLRRLEKLGLLTVIDEPADTPWTTDVYQLHVGATPDWGALKDSSRGSHSTRPHGQGESASKPMGQHVKVHKGKVTARKVSEVVNYVTHLTLAISTLSDALSSWFS